ncbi:Thermostable carboxypeptidase 1 [Prochlorococcus sp. MIT 0703]|nr:Thermostable carboxypeptidase 1 [Prochlorococcus sp. MIT 0701]KGG30294.1 Thermostable carboxypeptidase 1 [Prochlorococcus sp. MIT 0703]
MVRGNEHQLLAWLREHLHPIGRMMNAEKLVKRVTGQALSRKPFLDCLEGKLKQLQELNRCT